MQQLFDKSKGWNNFEVLFFMIILVAMLSGKIGVIQAILWYFLVSIVSFVAIKVKEKEWR